MYSAIARRVTSRRSARERVVDGACINEGSTVTVGGSSTNCDVGAASGLVPRTITRQPPKLAGQTEKITLPKKPCQNSAAIRVLSRGEGHLGTLRASPSHYAMLCYAMLCYAVTPHAILWGKVGFWVFAWCKTAKR